MNDNSRSGFDVRIYAKYLRRHLAIVTKNGDSILQFINSQIWILAVTALVVAAGSPPTYLYEPPRVSIHYETHLGRDW